MWRSLVAHFVRDEGAVGSNPAIPILLYIAPTAFLPWVAFGKPATNPDIPILLTPAPTALLPWVAFGKPATNPAIGAWEVFA